MLTSVLNGQIKKHQMFNFQCTFKRHTCKWWRVRTFSMSLKNLPPTHPKFWWVRPTFWPPTNSLASHTIFKSYNIHQHCWISISSSLFCFSLDLVKYRFRSCEVIEANGYGYHYVCVAHKRKQRVLFKFSWFLSSNTVVK